MHLSRNSWALVPVLVLGVMANLVVALTKHLSRNICALLLVVAETKHLSRNSWALLLVLVSDMMANLMVAWTKHMSRNSWALLLVLV